MCVWGGKGTYRLLLDALARRGKVFVGRKRCFKGLQRVFLMGGKGEGGGAFSIFARRIQTADLERGRRNPDREPPFDVKRPSRVSRKKKFHLVGPSRHRGPGNHDEQGKNPAGREVINVSTVRVRTQAGWFMHRRVEQAHRKTGRSAATDGRRPEKGLCPTTIENSGGSGFEPY